MQIEVDRRWAGLGFTSEFLEETANWLRDPRKLHGKSARFFEMAGSLISLSRFDFLLCSPAFFQGVFGLEAALKLHYNADNKCLGLLFSRAVQDGVVYDALLKNNSPIPKELKEGLGAKDGRHQNTKGQSIVKQLSKLIPKLRNQFVHGTYLLNPGFLRLTIHLREMADALTTKETLPKR